MVPDGAGTDTLECTGSPVVLGAMHTGGAAVPGDADQVINRLVPQGTDYKLTLSWLYRPFHPWQWPKRTSTGWCFGRVGVHAKVRTQEVMTGL